MIRAIPGKPGRLGRIAGLTTSLDTLAEQWSRTAKPDIERRDVVVVVHGTFANPPRDGRSSPLHWWQDGGSFTKALDTALARHGSPARCNHPFSLRALNRFNRRPSWFGWSGDNSEVGRRQGAFELAAYLRALQEDEEIGTIHIVAHSHGGNVVRRAMRYLNTPHGKLGAFVCVGTPFLHFNDRAAWRRWIGRVHWPMVFVLAGILAGLWFMRARNDSLTNLIVSLIGAGAIYSIWHYARTSQASSVDVGAVGVRFQHDEAIQALRVCAQLAAEPHAYVRDLLGGAAPPRLFKKRPYASGPRGWFERIGDVFSAVGRIAWNAFAGVSNVWNGPVCRIAEHITTWCYRIPLLGGLLGSLLSLLLILGFRPYRPRLRPFLLSRMPRLAALFFHSFNELGERAVSDALSEPSSTYGSAVRGSLIDPETAQGLAAFLAFLLYIVWYPIDLVLGLPSWLFGGVMTRFAILLGARAAAASAPGMDMIGAAFRGARTGQPPKGVLDVIVPEPIEQDIERRLAAGRIDFTTLRASLDPAARASLLDALKKVFTDVDLLHAQYYQDARVIDFVAQCISGSTQAWVHDATALSHEGK